MRPRLTSALADRFEHRLTTVVGSAGSGKTTALAQALASNKLTPEGRDVWLGLHTADADPSVLFAGLAEALSLRPIGEPSGDLAAIGEAIWSAAPERVVLILDDVHVVGSSEVLTELLDALPSNAALVVIGRYLPPLPLTELRARHELLEVTERDLELDLSELGALAQARGTGNPQTLSRHAASADLGLVAGPSAGIDYLWQKILLPLDPIRLRMLQRVAVLDEVDDDLALELSDGRFRAQELTVGLPLVEHHDNGGVRLHDLLRTPLAEHLAQSEVEEALRSSAVLERARGRLVEACELAGRIPDAELAVAVARDIAALPMLRVRNDQLRRVCKVLRNLSPDGAVRHLLETQLSWGVAPAELEERFRRAADLAAGEHDALIETIACYRAAQAGVSGPKGAPRDLFERICRHSDEVPWARGVCGHLESQHAQILGDVDTAIAALDKCDALPPAAAQVMRAERLCDLGRPEAVAVDFAPDEVGELPVGADLFVAFALWLRGAASPEDALALGADLVPGARASGQLEPAASLLAIMTIVAIGAGDLATAEDYLESTRNLGGEQNRRVEQFLAIAEASMLVAHGDEEAAVALLADADMAQPLQLWPERPALLALPLLYVAQPHRREMLERCSFGPSLNLAVRAAAALVGVRDGDPSAAARLPWSDVNVLRAHVPPAMLTELAGAAAASGSSGAMAVFSAIADPRVGLARLAQHQRSDVAAWATARLQALPVEAPHRLEIKTLGSMELLRDGEPVTDSDWVRRARVRELLALLVEERSLTRSQAAAAIWPEQADNKAATNLSVTLSYLRGVLEPDRGSDREPYFVVTDGDVLRLAHDVDVDVDELDEVLRRANSLDAEGSPAAALAVYEQALALYAGPYLSEINAEWADISRMMIESRVRTALVRLGELELARGEPERAAQWGTRAWRASLIDERAARLLIGSMVATGDRAGAVDVARRLLAALADAGLGPDGDTQRSLGRLGLAAA